MWFKIRRRKPNGGRSGSASLNGASKSKKTVRRFKWFSLGHCKPGPLTPTHLPLSAGNSVSLPATPLVSSTPCRPVGRIRCGTTVIPIMRTSTINLKQPGALKRPATSFDRQYVKTRRLSGLGHFNPIYDDVCEESDAEEAIYEEILPLQKRKLITPASYLDLMEISVLIADSPVKRQRQKSRTPPEGIYALHGGDCHSIASGIYDDVASSCDSGSDIEFDTGVYGWTLGPTAPHNIPLVIPTFGGMSTDVPYDDSKALLRWMNRVSYVIH